MRYVTSAERKPRNARASIAERQHGLITTAQLLASGLSHAAITRRVASGELHRLGLGVYAVGHSALSPEGRWLAAVLGGGAGAALRRLSAAKLWEISRFAAPVARCRRCASVARSRGFGTSARTTSTRAMSRATGAFR